MLKSLAFVLISTVPALATPAASVCPAPQPSTNMTETFVSKFKTAAEMSSSQWKAVSGNPFGNPAIEAESYDPSEVGVSHAHGLRLLTTRGPLNGKPYKSGAVSTQGRFSQTYGRFEMKAKFPEQNGLWPAFWLVPANNTWPPEIDVIEYIYAQNGQIPQAMSSGPTPWVASNLATTLHWGTSSNHQQTAPSVNGNTVDVPKAYQDWAFKGTPTGFHTYAVDWRPGSINFLIDSKSVFCAIDTASTGPRVPSVPMYMIINDAVSIGTKQSPGWAGYVESNAVWPEVMDVAYVRVSQFKDLGTR